MDMNDIAAQTERYKREMMKLYGRRQEDAQNENAEEPEAITEESDEAESMPEAAADADRPSDEEIFGVDEEADDDSAYFPYSESDEEQSPDEDDEYNNRYPDPDLSELESGEWQGGPEDVVPPQYTSEESLGSGTGYILVNVRAGDESSPVENATVMVTAIVGGSRLIIAEGRTDSSGTTIKFAVPAPDVELSQSPGAALRPYNLFDVSVTAEGFFNARSVDVPVFSGITSIQNFSMIPVPQLMSSSDETLTYFNQEPDFGNIPQQ